VDEQTVETVEPEVEPETQTETTTPDIEKIKVEARLAGLKEAEEKYKGIQRTIAQKDRELEQLRKRSVPEQDDSILEFLLADKKKNLEYGDHDPVVAQLEAKIRERKIHKAQEDADRYREQKVSEAKAELENKLADADDITFKEMMIAVDDASWNARSEDDFKKRVELLHKKLDRTKEKAMPKVEPSKVDVEEDREKWYQERRRKEMAGNGELTTDAGMSSAGSGSWIEFEKRYVSGQVSDDEYRSRAIKEGKL